MKMPVMMVGLILMPLASVPVWAHGNEVHAPTHHDAENVVSAPPAHHEHIGHTEHTGHATHAASTASSSWPSALLWMPPVHPFLVHFPIAFLIVAGWLGGISLRRPSTARSTLVRWTLYASAVAAIAAMGSGLYFEAFVAHHHGGVIDPIMEWHERLGIATAVLTTLAAIMGWRMRHQSPARHRRLYWASIGLALLVTATSHLGGLLVHRFGVGL